MPMRTVLCQDPYAALGAGSERAAQGADRGAGRSLPRGRRALYMVSGDACVAPGAVGFSLVGCWVVLIIHRYVFREVLQVFVAVLGILLLIYVSNRFVRYLAQAASGYISSDVITQLILLKLAQNMSILLPLALYLAVLLALGRLYRDSEVIAMAAGGISVRRLAHALAWLGAGFALLAASLSLYFSPKAAELQQAVFEQAKGEALIGGIQAGRFREFGKGDRVVYVESISADGANMNNVFVRVRHRNGQDLIVAERAYPSVQGADGDRFMVLENGHRYSGEPGQLDFVVTQFERHAVRLEQASPSGLRKLEATPTLELLKQGSVASIAEFQWRLSVPISVVVLVLMAVPLARASPRQGRYAKLLTAFVLYFIYNNGLSIAQKLVEREQLHASIGVWPVHAVFFLGALCLLFAQSSLGWRWPRIGRRAAAT
ncbi:MAG: lipopolysaccharide export system permease protein [Gammaproteobacteria bacterium]|jgi:lipopolysaccharide export system permease protein